MLNVLSRVEMSICLLLESDLVREDERMFTSPFILLGKVTRAEWHKSFLLDEIYKSNFDGQMIPAPDNEFENINHYGI